MGCAGFSKSSTVSFLLPLPARRFGTAMAASARFSLQNLFHELSTPFCVRNTSQTRIFEICLRTPRRFAHEHVHERALASARRRSYESACRGKDTGRQRAALVERRCLLCTVGRRRWLLCTVSRQRWGAACSAHAIDGPPAGTGTMHRQPAALGRCLQCARDRRATGGQRDASAPHLRVARTILWTGNAPGLLRAATLLAICTSPIVRTRRQQSPCAPRPLSLLPLLPCVLLAAVIRADTASCF